LQKIISNRCEFVKLCHIDHSSLVVETHTVLSLFVSLTYLERVMEAKTPPLVRQEWINDNKQSLHMPHEAVLGVIRMQENLCAAPTVGLSDPCCPLWHFTPIKTGYMR